MNRGLGLSPFPSLSLSLLIRTILDRVHIGATCSSFFPPYISFSTDAARAHPSRGPRRSPSAFICARCSVSARAEKRDREKGLLFFFSGARARVCTPFMPELHSFRITHARRAVVFISAAAPSPAYAIRIQFPLN